ncbi:MAG TPA: glycoside hydrolase family 15 protein [Candidatus Xenobia bacterium]|jgi:GH15 family glucan-1,4-alpha-glucosidase
MPLPIEQYALLGNCLSSALVGLDGSIDWYCVPRFDSRACFAALLGTAEHGRWLIAPEAGEFQTERHYRGDTLVLETVFRTADSEVAVIDFMPMHPPRHSLIRIVEGRRGVMRMHLALTIRFDYGRTVPWVRKVARGILATAGPNSLRLRTDVPLEGEGLETVASFDVQEHQRHSFVLTWCPSHRSGPPDIDPFQSLVHTERSWRRWSDRNRYAGEWRPQVMRSLITLKALTYQPTGGVLAAPTTSLPEDPGGSRNWDYRFCWLRDATFTLYALLIGGYREESKAWRQWVLRAVAGNPEQVQVLYGLAGERLLTELEVPWLPGYKGAQPVRIGNAAHDQTQFDMVGEIMDAFHVAHKEGVKPIDSAWRFQLALLRWFETVWRGPDNGIWEIRGDPQHFTHSKVMAWVAFDRAIKAVQKFGFEGPVEAWKAIRQEIHDEVCQRGFDTDKNSFVQAYESRELDASTLMIPLVGFLPPGDPRVRGTVEAIEKGLMRDGFVLRYRTASGVDGLEGDEGAFLMCSFWLADNYELIGRHDDAVRMFERLLAIANDVGLLSEEFEPRSGRHLGNFPQALSHVGLINTARNLSPKPGGPAHRRYKA